MRILIRILIAANFIVHNGVLAITDATCSCMTATPTCTSTDATSTACTTSCTTLNAAYTTTFFVPTTTGGTTGTVGCSSCSCNAGFTCTTTTGCNDCTDRADGTTAVLVTEGTGAYVDCQFVCACNSGGTGGVGNCATANTLSTDTTDHCYKWCQATAPSSTPVLSGTKIACEYLCTCATATNPTCDSTTNMESTDPCVLMCTSVGMAASFTANTVGGTTGNISCIATTSTPTTTVTAGTTIPTCILQGNTMYCLESLETETEFRCETGDLIKTKLLVAKIFLLLGAVYVIIWCIVTIIINFMHKNKGHHRWIHFYEEIFIILMFLFIGLNLFFRNSKIITLCKTLSVLNQLFMTIVCGAFLMEAIFADSMAHNKKKKNGIIPPVVNYIVPIILGLIPALVTYFLEKDSYGATGIHCFATATANMFWGFVIPVWILLLLAGLKASLGNTACELTNDDLQDLKQVFWCRKSCKILLYLAFLLLTCWITALFGCSENRFAIIIVFFLVCLVFGPVLFIAHTYCHLHSQKKLYKRTGLIGRFYKPCPPKLIPFVPPPKPISPPSPPPRDPTPPPKPPPKKKPPPKAKTPPPPKPETPPPKPPTPPPKPPTPPPTPPPAPEPIEKEETHGPTGHLYDWATLDGKEGARDVLFQHQ